MPKPKVSVVLGVVIFLLGAYFVPWKNINWGKIEVSPAGTVTTTGSSKTSVKSQIARFTATVTETNKDKDTAVNAVNTKMSETLSKVKAFGIPEEDIQTQNVSVYEVGGQEIMLYPPKNVESGWRASNSIQITLRNVDQASELTDLLSAIDGVSLSGPSFSLDDTSQSEDKLLEEAISDATEKAQTMASASGRRLGKVITVSESGSQTPIYATLMRAEDTASTPISPGTETVSKTVTVVFELK